MHPEHGSALFDAIPDSAVLLDKAGRIVDWNHGAGSLLGYPKKEVMGRSINLIYDRNYPFPKIIQEIQQQSKKWVEETAFIRKNGTKGICRSCVVPLFHCEHSKATVLLVHQNITAYKTTEERLYRSQQEVIKNWQKSVSLFYASHIAFVDVLHVLDQTEQKLRESDLRFHLLAENATDIISRHLPDGTYLYVSPAGKSSLGYSFDQLFGKNIYKYIHHDDINKIKRAFRRRNKNQGNNTVVYRIRKKEGEYRWFESNIRLILDETSKAIREIQLASRDVSDRVQDKKARLRGQQLARVFRLSTMEEMASGLAHEISQPLSAIINYTRGCVRHLEGGQGNSSELVNVMEKAVRQAERAGEIIQRLKNFFCKGQLVITPCKMNNVIRETIGLIKGDLNFTKTKIDFHFDKSLPIISIDKIQIQQVMLNLLQNAMDAMKEYQTREKRINIQTRPQAGEMIEVTIQDTGPGFSKESINEVFKPFFTTKAHGRGMGLAICRSIIEAHGGQFSINPNTNNDSWIRFSLPLKQEVLL